MDVMADQLGPSRRLRAFACRAMDGRPFRLLNVLDDFNREGLGIEVDVSDRRENDLPDRFPIRLTPAGRVIRSLNPIGGTLIPRIKFWPASYIEWRGKPGTIRVDFEGSENDPGDHFPRRRARNTSAES